MTTLSIKRALWPPADSDRPDQLRGALRAGLSPMLLGQGRTPDPAAPLLAGDPPVGLGAAMQDIEGALEPTFLRAHHYRELLDADEAQRQAFLHHFHQRLTYVGSDTAPQTWSLLAWIRDHPDWPLALVRDRGSIMVATGVPGAGKTVLSTLVGEASFAPGGPVASERLLPTAFIFFHLEENDRLPQLLDALRPNPTPRDLELLMQRLGVGGRGLSRLRLVVPSWLMTAELMERLRPYQDLGLEVVELRVHLGEIGQPGLEAALGARSGSRYVQRMLEEAQRQGGTLRTSRMRQFIAEAEPGDLDAAAKEKAQRRVDVLEGIEAAEGAPGIWGLFGPGVATAVYLGGPHMGRNRVSPVLVSLLSGLMMPCKEYGEFQRVIVVDEVNLIDRDDPAWRMLVNAARLVRHRGWTLLLMGQDLLCAPDELFSAVGMCAAFQQSSPVAWEHLRHRVGPLRPFRWEDVGFLEPSFAVLTSLLSSDRQQAHVVRFRPPLCMHGGYTRGAI